MTLCSLYIEEASLTGFSHTLENLETQENDQINFQAWKRKKAEIPGIILEIFLTDMKLEKSSFLDEINDHKAFCSLLITNYAHGTGFPSQGIFNLFQARDSGICFSVREFYDFAKSEGNL